MTANDYSEPYAVSPVWAGERAFIIGGGPSLLKTPMLHMVPYWGKVIAVNNAYEIFTSADILYFGDVDWGDDNAAGIRRDFFGREIISRACGKDQWRLKVNWIGRDMSVGLSHCPSTVAGWCSGSNAINIAFLKGASEIVLLGFDMRGLNWHDKHLRPKKPNCYEVDFMPYLQRMADDLQKTECKVWNATPNSALKCFPYRELSEFLR